MTDSKPLTPNELRAALLAEAEAETQRHAESNDAGGDWLTVAEAAERLGITARSVQRRCVAGTLTARLVATETGQRWEIDPAALTSAPRRERRDSVDANGADDNDTDGVPQGNGATRTTSKASTKRHKRQTAPRRESPQTTGTTSQGDFGALPPLAAALIETQAGEIAHLRAQVEQHARAEAELRAALREALKISSKALPSSAQETTPTEAPAAQNGAQNLETVKPSNGVEPAHNGAQNEVAAARRGFWQRLKDWGKAPS